VAGCSIRLVLQCLSPGVIQADTTFHAIAHGFIVGDVLIISGMSDAAFNQTVTVATVRDAITLWFTTVLTRFPYLLIPPAVGAREPPYC